MKQFIFIFLLIFIIIFRLFSTDVNKIQNLNAYYQFPVSIGTEYEILSPFGNYGQWFNIYKITANIRIPLPFFPVIQPVIEGGIIRFDSRDIENPYKWDHYHISASLGIAYSYRFDRFFEIGADTLFGLTQSYFPDLIKDIGIIGGQNILIQCGLHISLNPSFNLLIDIHPNLKYIQSFYAIDIFNGLMSGLGISAHYRFGKDPDSYPARPDCIRFDNPDFPEFLFSNMQNIYSKKSFAQVNIINKEKHMIKNIDVLFLQSEYMDAPTLCCSIPELKANESRKVDILATFNDKIFQLEGSAAKPLTGEIIVYYSYRGRRAEQRLQVAFAIFDKKSIVWDDDRKLASFITPNISSIENYTDFIEQTCKNICFPYYSKNLQLAIQVYYALKDQGCIYQIDPILPLAVAKNNIKVIDKVNFPRETLKWLAGDCDDLTVLYLSILESAGIETGFISLKNHILPAFNTDVPARSFRELNPDIHKAININGNLWIPVEITFLGEKDFISAWEEGIRTYHKHQNNSDLAFYKTYEAQKIYEPLSLPEIDIGLQYKSSNIKNNFLKDMDFLLNIISQDLNKEVKKNNSKEGYNEIGILAAKLNNFETAEKAFRNALGIDPAYIDAVINTANLYNIQGFYDKALEYYQTALKELETDPKNYFLFYDDITDQINIIKEKLLHDNYRNGR